MPGILDSSMNSGGYLALSFSILSTLPVSISSRILVAVALPTPSILVNSAADSAVMSPPWASRASLAFS